MKINNKVLFVLKHIINILQEIKNKRKKILLLKVQAGLDTHLY